MKSPIIEAVKEAGRYTVFMGLSIFVSTLIDKLTAIKTQDVYVVVLTLILRAIDKYLHEVRKDKASHTEAKPMGILPF